MYNYFVFRADKTKERIIVKEVTDRMLRIFRLKNNVPISMIINWKQLGYLSRRCGFKYIGRYTSYGSIPAPINFEDDYKIIEDRRSNE